MYVRVTKGSGWYAGKEGHVFEVDSKNNDRYEVPVYYVDEAGADRRRFVKETECEEVELPELAYVLNETGLIEYFGKWYRLANHPAEEGDTILVTHFDDEDVACFREVESMSSFGGDFYMDADINGETYLAEDGDAYLLMEPVELVGTHSSLMPKTVEEPMPFEIFRPKTPVEPETVDHPSHYTAGKFETIEIIEEVTKGYEDSFVGYCVGNTQKYIARAPFKSNQLEDLRKARKYLDFAIGHLEGGAHE